MNPANRPQILPGSRTMQRRPRAHDSAATTALACILCALSACTSAESTRGARDAASPSTDAGVPLDSGARDAADAADAAPAVGNGCSVTVPNADVKVSLPSGVFEARYGAFGILDGECGGVRMVVAPEPHTLTQIGMSNFADHPAMFVSPRTYDRDTNTWISGRARVGMFGPSAESAQAAITIDEFVPPWPMTGAEPRVRATFTLDQEGWSGGGSVELLHCPGLDIYCP